MYEQLRRRVFDIVDMPDSRSLASRAFHSFIFSLIIANVVVFVLQTVPSIYDRNPPFFLWFERISVLIFTVEYLLRMWSCTASPKYARPVLGRLRFAVTPLAIIDLLSIVPGYIPSMTLDLRVIRVMRLFRLFRVLKLARYSGALQFLGRVVYAKKEELLIGVCILLMLLVVGSSLLYLAEHEDQPETFGSIPEAMWCTIITLTTVGYGDICPRTMAGKIIAGIVAVMGIGMFALPTAVMGAGFLDELQKRRKQKIVCPHCGKEIPDADRGQENAHPPEGGC